MPKILIVDDDITITELMKALVKMEGHEPTAVNDSLQAMEIAKSLNPDLITLDLMMPGLTGFELCKLLHDDQNSRTHRSLSSAQKMTRKARNKAIQAGAIDYLTKPFGLDEFINKIKPCDKTNRKLRPAYITTALHTQIEGRLYVSSNIVKFELTKSSEFSTCQRPTPSSLARARLGWQSVLV